MYSFVNSFLYTLVLLRPQDKSIYSKAGTEKANFGRLQTTTGKRRGGGAKVDGGGGDDQERKNFLFLLEWKTKKERESCLGGKKKEG